MDRPPVVAGGRGCLGSDDKPMRTNGASEKERIDTEPRTRRACEGCMIVVPHGNGSGRFDVYSANDGVNKTYTVDLRAETCECGDFEHRAPAGGCKHLRRVKLSIGIMAVPEDVDLDSALVRDREKYGVDPEPDPEPLSSGEKTALADGGAVVEDGAAYTVHVEPAEQGGGSYARCRECKREILPVGRFENLEHAEECTLR